MVLLIRLQSHQVHLTMSQYYTVHMHAIYIAIGHVKTHAYELCPNMTVFCPNTTTSGVIRAFAMYTRRPNSNNASCHGYLVIGHDRKRRLSGN